MLSVFSVPAIFVLTLTLPVVDDGNREEGAIQLPEGEDEPLVPNSDLVPEEQEYDEEEDPLLRPDVGEGLHQLVEGGFSPLHSPLGRIHQRSRPEGREIYEEDDHVAQEGQGEEDEEIEKGLMEEMEDEEAMQFNKALCAVQCVLGPTFCSYIVFGMSPNPSLLHHSLRPTPLTLYTLNHAHLSISAISVALGSACREMRCEVVVKIC